MTESEKPIAKSRVALYKLLDYGDDPKNYIRDGKVYEECDSYEDIEEKLAQQDRKTDAEIAKYYYIDKFADEGWALFIKQVFDKTPEWVRIFLENKIKLRTTTLGAVVIQKVHIDAGTALFAIPLGPLGRHMLDAIKIERGFGKSAALRMIDPDKIIELGTKEMSGSGRFTRQQIAAGSSFDSYSVDIFSNILTDITATASPESNLTSHVKGNQALSIYAKMSLPTLTSSIESTIGDVSSRELPSDFDWTEYHSEISDELICNELFHLAFDRAKHGERDGLTFALPAMQDFDIEYALEWRGKRFDSFSDCSILDDIDNFTPEILGEEIRIVRPESLDVSAKNEERNDGEIPVGVLSVRECLEGSPSISINDAQDSHLPHLERFVRETIENKSERILDDKTKKKSGKKMLKANHDEKIDFFLFDGAWLLANRDFLTKLNKYINDIQSSSIEMRPFYVDSSKTLESDPQKRSPLTGLVNEDKYLRERNPFKDGRPYLILDHREVYGRRSSVGDSNPNATKMEVCDILTTEEFIHVKKNTSANNLSHLFSQGLNSATRLVRDQDYRTDANAKIDEIYGAAITNKAKKPDDKDNSAESKQKNDAPFGDPGDRNVQEFHLDNPRDKTIVFAIVDDSTTGRPALTTLSKISLFHTHRRLRELNFTVKLCVIGIES